MDGERQEIAMNDLIPYPLPELLDRLSICMLKCERIGDQSSTADVLALKGGVQRWEFHDADRFLEKLHEVNGRIWDLEADIRAGLDQKLGLEEIGRRAIKIREMNKERIAIKNEISSLAGCGFQEVKKNHISE